MACSDDCQEKAELVARREQIGAEVARFENRVAEAQEELKNRQTARDQLDASWRETWSTCGLSPKSPEAMAEWAAPAGAIVGKAAEPARNRSPARTGSAANRGIRGITPRRGR